MPVSEPCFHCHEAINPSTMCVPLSKAIRQICLLDNLPEHKDLFASDKTSLGDCLRIILDSDTLDSSRLVCWPCASSVARSFYFAHLTRTRHHAYENMSNQRSRDSSSMPSVIIDGEPPKTSSAVELEQEDSIREITRKFQFLGFDLSSSLPSFDASSCERFVLTHQDGFDMSEIEMSGTTSSSSSSSTLSSEIEPTTPKSNSSNSSSSSDPKLEGIDMQHSSLTLSSTLLSSSSWVTTSSSSVSLTGDNNNDDIGPGRAENPKPRLFCPLCQRRQFDSDSKLKEHLARHNPDRPYECTKCRLQFPTYALLKLHKAATATTHKHPPGTKGKR